MLFNTKETGEANFFNVFLDYLQPYGHEMLSWVRLRGINAHSFSPPAR